MKGALSHVHFVFENRKAESYGTDLCARLVYGIRAGIQGTQSILVNGGGDVMAMVVVRGRAL